MTGMIDVLRGRMVTRIVLTITMLIVVSTGAWAQSDQRVAGAQAFLEGFSHDALTLLTVDHGSVDERDERLRGLLKSGFDLETIARFVTGRHWRRASQPERDEFMVLLEDLIVRVYAKRLQDFSADFNILGGRPDGRRDAIVKMEVFSPQLSQPVNVEWRLREISHGEFRILDAVVEGVSMLVAQRSDFNAVIQSNGGRLAGLNDALRTKVSRLASN